MTLILKSQNEFARQRNEKEVFQGKGTTHAKAEFGKT